MTIPWLVVWAVCRAPHVHPWNGWFFTLLIALVLDLAALAD